MNIYRISDLNVEVKTDCETLKRNLEPYKVNYECKPNLSLSMSHDMIVHLMEEHEGTTAEKIQIDYFAYAYSRSLFDFNGVAIRSVAVENGDSCILFSSPCENVNLLDYLPKEKVFAVDFPGIRLMEDRDKFYAYDTPFGDHGNIGIHKMLSVSALVFVDSERFNSLKRIEPSDFVPLFTRAVMLNIVHERTKHTLFMLEKFNKYSSIYGVKDINDIDFILERL